MMMTDPEKFIASRQTIAANVQLLHELKAKGYKLYILSNWDAASFSLFQTAFPEIFKSAQGKDMFDGIMISGQEKIVKPEISLFEKCLKIFKLTAQNTIFIDDEPANIAAAQKLGIHTVLSDINNIKAVRAHVIKILES